MSLFNRQRKSQIDKNENIVNTDNDTSYNIQGEEDSGIQTRENVGTDIDILEINPDGQEYISINHRQLLQQSNKTKAGEISSYMKLALNIMFTQMSVK